MVLHETITSKHTIKPSSPTPDNLKNHKLTYLDQIAVPIYIPLIFFYEFEEAKHKPHAEISNLLKQSLSQILAICRPFAGTVKENSYVDCNDVGVEFVEARVHARLVDVTKEPQMAELKHLAPADCKSHNEDAAILLVKLSFFDCGGIAVGVCLSHKVANFASLIVFMNAWAAESRGEAHYAQPRFDMAAHFPPKDSTPSCFPPEEEEINTRRLVFDKEKLAKLKRMMASDEVTNPTTVEALTIFLWKQFMEAHKSISGAKEATYGQGRTQSDPRSATTYGGAHAINLRPRTVPPIPDYTVGSANIVQYAFVADGDDMLTNLRAAFRVVDDDYVKKVVNSGEYLRQLYKVGELFLSGTVFLSFTSWWRFPMYGVDFGWGKPVWVSSTGMPYNNTVVFMSTPSEDGIEAWINMYEDFFQILEANYNKFFD